MRTEEIEVEYLHKLTEDIEKYIWKGQIVLRTSDPEKRETYSVFNGIKRVIILPEKVKVYQLTTRHIVEELPVE